MQEIWGKKCIFIDVLVVSDYFASILGVHASGYKEKKIGSAISLFVLNLQI